MIDVHLPNLLIHVRDIGSTFSPLGEKWFGKNCYYIKQAIAKLQKTQHIGGNEQQIWYLKAKAKTGIW